MPMGIGLGLTFTLTNQSVLDFLASLSDGFAFDFAQTDRHFQESVGPTLADDVTDPIGLALENREWNGRTLAQELATQAELRGTGALALVGVATAATYNTGTGVGTVTRVDFSNQSLVQIPVTANKTYAVEIEGDADIWLRESAGFAIVATIPSTTRQRVFVRPTSSPVSIAKATSAGTLAFTLHSFKEVPTRHGVQSSSSLRGARAVFNGYSDDQANILSGAWTMSVAGGTSTATESPSGTLNLTPDGTNEARGDKSFATEIGKSYRVTATVTGQSVSASTGSTQGGTETLAAQTLAVGTISYSFVATATTTWLRFARTTPTTALTVSAISVRNIPASRITTGCKYDGSDDNHLTPYRANVVVGGANLGASGFTLSVSGGTGTATESPSGQLNLTGDGSLSAVADKSYTTVAGRTYEVSFTGASSGVTAHVGATQGTSGLSGGNITGAVGSNRFYFTATGTTSWLGFFKNAAALATVSAISVKEVTNQDNFIVIYVTVPVAIATAQIFLGCSTTTGDRLFLAINTSGKLCGGVGAHSLGVIVDGTVDWRGRSFVCGLSFDGTTVRLFNDDRIGYEAAQNGAPTTLHPIRIGASNANGAVSNPTAALVADAIAGPEYLNLARYLQIRNYLINQ